MVIIQACSERKGRSQSSESLEGKGHPRKAAIYLQELWGEIYPRSLFVCPGQEDSMGHLRSFQEWTKSRLWGPISCPTFQEG